MKAIPVDRDGFFLKISEVKVYEILTEMALVITSALIRIVVSLILLTSDCTDNDID